MSSTFKTSPTDFYIQSNNLLLQNQIFLNNIQEQHDKKIIKRITETKSKNKTYSIEIIKNEERETLLKSSINTNLSIKSFEVINNFTGEIFKVNSFDKLNNFKKKLLDNRFISLVLTEEYNNNGLFITLTTKPLNNLNKEVYQLEIIYKEIYKLLKKHKIKFIKQYELTKRTVPHIHLLILDNSIKKEIELLLKNYENNTLIQEVKKEETHIVAYYMTKICNQDLEHKLYLSFEKELKNNEVKLFTSSMSKIFNKKQRVPLWNSFLLHSKYYNQDLDYHSENFMFFVFNFVKTNTFNTHLDSDIPHFILKGNEIYHYSNLRVFSKFSRVDKEEKRSIKKTHSLIIEYSKLTLNIDIEYLSIIYLNYTNNPYSYIFYYIVITIKIRIIIIKPPP